MSTPTASIAPAPRLGARLLERWRGLSLRHRAHLVVVLLATIGAVVHNALLWDWYVEDAAISFAFARNLADGEGLVATVGGERIEGYSNPTWVALLAFFELFGAPSEASARWIQVVLAALTVPVVYLLGREAAPEEDSDVPALAAVVLAGSAQFAIWGSSGLENGLFNLFLALALWRGAVEVRTGGWPWSAFWFFLLAASRPEAILYAAVGGFVALIASLEARRGLLPTAKWLVTFFAPFGAYQAARWWYFAWPFPNTYYAKLDHQEPRPYAWSGRGWKYVRDWADKTKLGFFVPVFLLGMTGGQGWRPLAGVVATTALGVAVMLGSDQRLLLPVVLLFSYAVFYTSTRWQSGRPPVWFTWGGLAIVAAFVGAAEYLRHTGAESKVPSPAWVMSSPPYVLAALFVILPLLSGRRRGWQARAACWGMVGVAVFFACYAMGDWMSGFRWLSMATVPGAVLMAAGAHAVGDVAQTLFGREEGRWTAPAMLASFGVVGALVPPNVQHTMEMVEKPETSPYSVRERVEYKQRVRQKLHIEGPIVDLDVDQGAHVYWSDHKMLDIAGLVDVPLAHQKFAKPFVREYLFVEEKPHFAHVHGGWASSSKIPTHAEWRRDYFELPGYPAGKTQVHPGNFARRDLMMDKAWAVEGPDRRVGFADPQGAEKVTLVGWDVPSPEVGAGRSFFVELGLDTPRLVSKNDGFRVTVFLSDGEHLAAWDAPPGHDWLKPETWRAEEIFHGRFSNELPEELPPGTYELGFVVFGKDGAVMPARSAPAGAVVGGIDGQVARLAVGEVRFPGVVRIVAQEEAAGFAQADLEEALARAAAGDCDAAKRAWWLARMHQPRAAKWKNEHEAAVGRALADCWVGRAASSPEQAVASIAEARAWDRKAPSVVAAAAPVAERRWADGVAAREAKDWEAAYRAFSDVLKVDPTWSWARRYAEEARAYRLGLDEATLAAAEQERQKRADAAKERLDRRNQDAAAPGEAEGEGEPEGAEDAPEAAEDGPGDVGG